jgi:decaprenylphospho-beta-D-ribofuranose 2-oxidase
MADAGGRIEELGCYSRLYTRTVEVERPAGVDALRATLRRAVAAGRKVTLRSGGMSFDRQALNGRGEDDAHADGTGAAPLVVSLAGWDRICWIDDERGTMRVQAGATWGAIMRALLPRGLVPAVTVTTSGATAGGTLSANALSRFSSAYGKEGTCVIEAEIVTPDGRCPACRPPPQGRPAAEWTPEERLFMAAVGGLGYVGAFTEITYRLLRIPQPRIKTVVRRFWRLESFADAIAAAASRAEQETSDPLDPTKRDAIYGAVYTGRWLRQAMLFTSSYTHTTGEPMLIHKPDHPLRPAIDRTLATPVKPLLWLFGFATLPRKSWVDPVWSFAFFQDGNARTMERYEHLKLVQQTFVIPRPALADWLAAAARRLRKARVRPILEDVVALPKDRPFVLSVTPDRPAFGVTYTFLIPARKVRRTAAVLRELADLALDPYGGRISLVKNVFAEASTVRRMFGEQVEAFARVRAEARAAGVLSNDLLDETLGG